MPGINPRLYTKSRFFCNKVYEGGWLPPSYELENCPPPIRLIDTRGIVKMNLLFHKYQNKYKHQMYDVTMTA